MDKTHRVQVTYKRKRRVDEKVESYKARLVAKAYS